MNLLGWTGKVDVKPLSKEAAVDLGAELLGEFIIFSIAVTILYAETKRSQMKDRVKEEKQNAKLQNLQDQINGLSVVLHDEIVENNKLVHLVDDLTEKINKIPVK